MSVESHEKPAASPGAAVDDSSSRTPAATLHSDRFMLDLVAAQEAASASVAGELHEAIAQEQASLLYLTQTLELQIARDGTFAKSGPALTSVRKLRAGLHSALNELRRVANTLAPIGLQEVGLNGVISSYVAMLEQSTASTTIQTDLEELDLPIATSSTLTLYRVLQEALGNAIRYAHPSTIRVRLRQRGEFISLEVSDDGPEVAAIGEQRGSGIRLMRERTELVGGTFEVETSSSGTTIRAIVPTNVLI